MNTSHFLVAAAALSAAGFATAGTAAFLEIDRIVSGVGAGDLGQGCVTVPVADGTDRFGPFVSGTGIPLFTSGTASQISTASPSSLVFGTGEVFLAGVATCDGNAVTSSIEMRFAVEGTLMLLLEGSVTSSANRAATSKAAVVVEVEDGPIVYEAAADAGGDTPSADAALGSPLILTSGTYVLHIVASAQDALLGEPLSASASYDVSISFPAVLNDDCVAAEPIELDGFSIFDTTFATTDGPAEPGCFAEGAGQVDADVWYVYESACDAWLILSTCGLADFDSRLAVYDGCPSSGGALVACNDDAADCFGGTSLLLVPVYSGRSYLVRVGGADGARGAGGLQITCEIPNDYCEDILAIDVGPIPFSTVGATTDGPPLEEACAEDGDDQIHNDIWFEVVADCTGALRATACGDADFETRVAIYPAGCPTEAGSELSCGAAGRGCGRGASAVTAAAKGETYVVRLGGAAIEMDGEWLGLSGHGTLVVACVACAGDLNGDLMVDGADLGELLAAWGGASSGADLSGDGVVEGADLGELLSGWGPCV